MAANPVPERLAQQIRDYDELLARSPKLDRERVLGRIVDQNMSVILAALTAAQQQGQAVATLTVDRTGAHFDMLPAWHALPHGKYHLYTAPPPSAPVGVGGGLLERLDAIHRQVFGKSYPTEALAQQPAAVDEAKVSAALSRLARNEYGDPRTAAANRSRDIRAIRDALATQHQEPKS